MTRVRNKECNEPCIVCGTDAVYHHVKSFGSGGETVPHNLMPFCTLHHGEMHDKATMKMSVKYWKVKRFLIDNGWEVCNLRNKWTHNDN